MGKLFRRSADSLFSEMRDDIKGEIKPEEEAEIEAARKKGEMAFFLKVMIPCWLIYGQSPSFLLRRARMGDLNAAQMILRIDPSAVFDSRISQQMHQLLQEGKRTKYDSLVDALRKPPKAPMHRSKAKERIGGLILFLAEALNQKLTKTQICNLFDAIAKDAGRGEIDPDIKDSKQAYSKNFQRQKREWKKLLTRVDKK